MKNRFNKLTSKEWLPFQKSWFKHSDDEKLYRDNIRFFSKAEDTDEPLLYYGHQFELFEKLAHQNHLKAEKIENFNGVSQYIFIDLRKEIAEKISPTEYTPSLLKIENLLLHQFDNLSERRFVTVIAQNSQQEKEYYPYAWDIAKNVSQIYSLKDEKIGCKVTEPEVNENDKSYFEPSLDVYYCLYFRKDEFSKKQIPTHNFLFFKQITQLQSTTVAAHQLPKWFILKPQPRKKNEILHPAKYPESLAELFINYFTQEHSYVFDPMTGTGSTQLAALKLHRNAYGTELSGFFTNIADSRGKEFLFQNQENLQFKILNKDARLITPEDFLQIDYVITSPPYWDMLNMKGAENQAKRVEKGLQTNYSDDPTDLGNINDYEEFLLQLQAIYFNIASLMKPKSYITIVVKNIKKKGKNYPFAWDLSALLQEKLLLLPEVFWLQDDISIAPYGYGNTFVSNTFHQYCLTFQIPENFSNEPPNFQ